MKGTILVIGVCVLLFCVWKTRLLIKAWASETWTKLVGRF